MSIAADERYVYVAYGKTPWRLLACDRQTGESEVLLTAPATGHIGVQQYRNGCAATVREKTGADAAVVEYWLHGGRAIRRSDEAPPWGAAPDVSPPGRWPPRPELDWSRMDPMGNPDGRALLRYRLPGQAWAEVRFDPPKYPVAIGNLVELPDGRIFGSSPARAFFVFDPRTDQSRMLGSFHLENSSAVVAHGKVCLSGYPRQPSGRV